MEFLSQRFDLLVVQADGYFTVKNRNCRRRRPVLADDALQLVCGLDVLGKRQAMGERGMSQSTRASTWDSPCFV